MKTDADSAYLNYVGKIMTVSGLLIQYFGFRLVFSSYRSVVEGPRPRGVFGDGYGIGGIVGLKSYK